MWIVGTGYQGARVLYPMWDICILHVGYAHTYYTPCEVHTYIVNTLVLILSMPSFIYVHDTPIRVHPSLNIVLNSNRQDQIVCSAKNAHYIQCVWMQWVRSAPLPRIQSLHPQWVLIVPTTSPPGTHNVQATVLGKAKHLLPYVTITGIKEDMVITPTSLALTRSIVPEFVPIFVGEFDVWCF